MLGSGCSRCRGSSCRLGRVVYPSMYIQRTPGTGSERQGSGLNYIHIKCPNSKIKQKHITQYLEKQTASGLTRHAFRRRPCDPGGGVGRTGVGSPAAVSPRGAAPRALGWGRVPAHRELQTQLHVGWSQTLSSPAPRTGLAARLERGSQDTPRTRTDDTGHVRGHEYPALPACTAGGWERGIFRESVLTSQTLEMGNQRISPLLLDQLMLGADPVFWCEMFQK